MVESAVSRSPGRVLTPAGLAVITGEEALAAQTAVATGEVLTAAVGTHAPFLALVDI